MKEIRILILILLSSLFVVACAPNTPETVEAITAPKRTSPNRTILTADELLNGFVYDSPVNEGAFVRPENALPPAHIFEGKLILLNETEVGEYEVVRGNISENEIHLPEFEVAFVQSRSGDLVPATRGRLVTDHAIWNYIIGPGRAWYETEDGNFSRASFPFALILKGGNSTYNGTMMFLFNDEEVSKVWYQVTQEISFYDRVNLWGLVDAVYESGDVMGAEEFIKAHDQEIDNRMPTRPIAQLTEFYPDIDLDAFGAGVHPDHMSTYGFVVDGINYVSGCNTRYGEYAYCDAMRMASWSTAKSAFAAVALMRLAQEYGPQVEDELIADYFPSYITEMGDWSKVTFDHVLDMATGHFNSANRMQDEDKFSGLFWESDLYTDKIIGAFEYPHSTDPGEVWVYHTSDTFIVTSAMQHFLELQTGTNVDLFDYVYEGVYRPIGVGPGIDTARTADNNWEGYALGGYGIWWIRDDVAKLALLLMNGGVFEGEQILHPDMVADALQQNPEDRGVEIGGPRSYYNNAFWATRYNENQNFACEFWVAQMQGISGVVVVLLPNDTAYYYFSDNQEFVWDAVVREANKISAYCET